MTVVPDAWDECAACGHDRDDHRRPGGGCDGYTAVEDNWQACGCRGFEAAS